MSSTFGVAQAGQSLQAAWSRVGAQTQEITDQLATGDAGSVELLDTIVKLKTLKLQAEVAGKIFETLNDVAGELLTKPRK